MKGRREKGRKEKRNGKSAFQFKNLLGIQMTFYAALLSYKCLCKSYMIE
jgi:hypothetical protein